MMTLKTASMSMLLTLSTLITGCETFKAPTKPQAQAWQERQQEMAAVTTWDMRGRIHQGGTFSFAASLSWLQQADTYKINVIGPFGNPNVSIKGNQETVHMRWSEGELTTNNPERDWQRNMGWHLPIRDLQYWVRGIPSPNAKHEYELDDYGQLAILKQSGWTITYKEYKDQKQGTMPYPVELVALKDEKLIDKDGKPVPLTFTVLIKRWFPRF